MTYDEIVQKVGSGYTATAHQIVQLANGRPNEKGARLLVRSEEPGQGPKQVRLSRRGIVLARQFARADLRSAAALADRHEELSEHLRESTLPGLERLAQAMPGISLTTAAIFLHVATHQDESCYDKKTAKELLAAMRITNLTRHLNILLQGKEGWATEPVIRNVSGHRLIYPALSDAGVALIAEIAALVIGETSLRPRLPREDRLRDLDRHEDIANLGDDDFHDDPPD